MKCVRESERDLVQNTSEDMKEYACVCVCVCVCQTLFITLSICFRKPSGLLRGEEECVSVSVCEREREMECA